MDAGIVIAVILAFIIGLFLMRALGAWMLRIDEVIKPQKETVFCSKGLKLTSPTNQMPVNRQPPLNPIPHLLPKSRIFPEILP